MGNEGAVIRKTSVSPLRASLIQPFRTSLGTHHSLENLKFTMTLQDGTTGCGEAPVATHITGETLEATSACLKEVGAYWQGKDAGQYLAISHFLHQAYPGSAAAIAAVETALMDALTRRWKIPLWKFYGTKPTLLKTDITLVLGDLEETQKAAALYYRRGFRAFKIKIGRDRDLDFKRVCAIRRLAPRSKIYLDANQGYTVKETVAFFRHLEKARVSVDLLEQPVKREDWKGLKELARRLPVAVCADESVRTFEEALRVVKEKAVPVINIKVAKFGLIHAAEIARLAAACGIQLMISGMLESSLAMTASAHLAAGLGCFHYIDLDTPFFIKHDVARNPYLSADGIYDLRRVRVGIGLTGREA